MSFHPNELARRARLTGGGLTIVFGLLLSAFFRTQIVQNTKYRLQSEENRLREVPLPAPRGVILDRHGQIIAENIPGYSVSLLSPRADSLRASLKRLAAIVPLSPDQIESSVRRYRTLAEPSDGDLRRRAVRRGVGARGAARGVSGTDHPVRAEAHYPDGPAVASFVGYVGEITEPELALPRYRGYKAGSRWGRAGLEKQYEDSLRGREGMRFVEVDAHGRVVREAGSARPDLLPSEASVLQTNIDLDLQRYTSTLFGDSLQGGAIALDPKTGAVLALYSAPGYDPNRFIGGIPPALWKQLNDDPRHPLYNKVIQGRYPPGSTWKLATAITALQAGLVTMDDEMPTPCTGGYQFGNRYFRCWEKRGHGSVTLAKAIEVSCDVYFYQLGLKVGLARLIAGGASLGFGKRTDIDLPEEAGPRFPYTPAEDYYNRRYGKNGWSQAVILNLAIGQGENDQTVASMGASTRRWRPMAAVEARDREAESRAHAHFQAHRRADDWHPGRARRRGADRGHGRQRRRSKA